MSPKSLQAVADLASYRPGSGSLTPTASLNSDAPVRSLDGDWRFHFWPSVAAAPDGVEQTDYDDSGWDLLPVPSSWGMPWHDRTLRGEHGKPWYTNIVYPFPVDPPFPPDANPVGDHRLSFDLAEVPARAELRFEGIEGAGTIYLNGILLGTTRGSRLPTVFDVSEALRVGANLLVVRVAQFSGASYLEDQDMWWLPGIIRSVTLRTRPLEGAIEDVFVHADYDASTGTGTLRVDAKVLGGIAARVSIDELGISAADGTLIEIGAVEPWSAEFPRLYQLTVSTQAETVSLQIGFRRVEIRDAQLLINGRPLKFRGVNRHEHHPDFGRAVPSETVESELRLMKRHNINAIRTSHYPPTTHMLDLADRLGFYVIDECDVETHGFGEAKWLNNPSDEPLWHDAYIDRAQRMLERDKNHACIIMWSLGNEAGTGQNLAAMSRWLKQRDPSRPIHYEGEQNCAYVDIWSKMYASHAEVDTIGRFAEAPLADPALEAHRRSLPFMQCEYAHAMGNSPGGLTEYQALFDKYPRVAGGFIWEWLEHGINVPTAEGTNRIAYGGDFDEPIHDGNFVIDGLVSPDRVPRPQLHDLKVVFAPVGLVISDDRGTLTVTNRFGFASTADLRFDWIVEGPDGRVAGGALDLPVVAAGDSVTLALPEEARQIAAPGVLTVSCSLRAATDWAEAGHEIAWAQAVVELAPALPKPLNLTAQPMGDGLVRLGQATFNSRTGQPVAFGDVQIADWALNLWRAPTDNDQRRGWDEHDLPALAERWAAAGLHRLVSRLVSFEAGQGTLTTVTRVAAPASQDGVVVRSIWTATDSGIHLSAEITPHYQQPIPWARLGFGFTVAPGFQSAEWFGNGPSQSYPDTGQAARAGWHAAGVADLDPCYVLPQEGGARGNISSFSLASPEAALTIAGSSLAVTVARWSSTELAHAAHRENLPVSTRTHIGIDHLQTGIGTASCGPGVLPQHRLWSQNATFQMTFSA